MNDLNHITIIPKDKRINQLGAFYRTLFEFWI